MIYAFLRVLVGWYMRIHVKRLFVKGIEQVPAQGPIIFAANHGNAFLDAIMLVLTVNRPIWYLARADVFKKAWQRWILKKLHLIPVYRLRDGIDSMEQNKVTFGICSQMMSEGKALLIFSEGNAVPELRLRPLKKGTARIAFQSAEEMQWKLPLVVVPVGINYTHHTEFRTEVMLGFGQAIKVADFRSEFESDASRGLLALTHAIFQGISEEMLIIPHREQDRYALVALAIGRGEKQYPLFRYRYTNEGRLDHDKAVLANFIEKDQPELREKLDRFAKRSRELHLPLSLAYARIPESRTAFLLLGFFPALLGLVFHALPMSISFWFTGKSVRDPQFVSSVLMGTGFFFNLIWYALWIIALAMIFPLGLPLLLVLPFFGYSCLLYSEALQQQRARSLRKKMN